MKRRVGVKLLFGFAAIALAATVAFAQDQGARAEVFRLQLQRFSGAYKLTGSGTGTMNLTESGKGSDWNLNASVNGKQITLKSFAGYDPTERKQKASIEMDGKSYKGTSTVDGRDLLLEGRDGKVVRRLRLHLNGRSQGSVTMTEQPDGKSETTLFDLSAKRG